MSNCQLCIQLLSAKRWNISHTFEKQNCKKWFLIYGTVLPSQFFHLLLFLRELGFIYDHQSSHEIHISVANQHSCPFLSLTILRPYTIIFSPLHLSKPEVGIVYQREAILGASDCCRRQYVTKLMWSRVFRDHLQKIHHHNERDSEYFVSWVLPGWFCNCLATSCKMKLLWKSGKWASHRIKSP